MEKVMFKMLNVACAILSLFSASLASRLSDWGVGLIAKRIARGLAPSERGLGKAHTMKGRFPPPAPVQKKPRMYFACSACGSYPNHKSWLGRGGGIVTHDPDLQYPLCPNCSGAD
jgi:hypothetical protein